MKFRLAVASVATAAALLAGCSSNSAGSSTARSGSPGSAATIAHLTMGDVTTYTSYDPNKTQGCNDIWCGLFMEHLLKLSPSYQVEPWLATMTQTSPVTYVYNLRHGVKFWDGTEMTSADVVYSLDYQRLPGVPTQVYFENVNSIQATSRYTVVITLKQPDAGWKYSLTYEGVIFEKRFALAHKSTLGNPGVLIQASGPWELNSLDPTRGAELSANPHWWGGKVPVQHISVKFFSSETSEALAMRAGEIDVAFPSDGKTFAASSGVPVESWPALSMEFFAMNPNVAPWSDVHVRRAVAYALNRTDIIAAYGGSTNARPASSLIPPDMLTTVGTQAQVNGLLNSIPQYPYDLAKARQQMAESSYPHGFTASTKIDNFGDDPNVIQVIASELKRIGISLNVHVESANQFYAEKYSSFTDVLWGLGAISPDPSIFPSYMLGSSAVYNAASYSSAAVSKLEAEGLTTSDPAKRLTIYGQILDNVAANLPYIALFQSNSFAAVSGKFTLPKLYTWGGFIPWAIYIRPA